MIHQATRSTPRADLGEAFHEFSPEGMTFVAAEVLPERPVAKKAATIGVVTRENVSKSLINTCMRPAAFCIRSR